MIENAIEFYYKTSVLKDTLRSGPVQWRVEREIKETIASHIYGTLMLAIGLYSEIKPNLNFSKVLLMLAVHETEEVLIGDITPLDKLKKSQISKISEEAVEKIFSILADGQKYVDIIKEYNEHKTMESHFAKACDKLECVLEFKKYCDAGQTSLEKVTAEMLNHPLLKKFYDEGKYSLDDIFYIYHMKAFEDLGFTEKLWFDHIKKMKSY